ncbi:alanine racemase [Paenibacillus eucommiae]|uniref:D-serine deaminase-like pyridoxal phosphate-dependent protein n=1 Tax=Paenibacillus eucommiae TaxID=1355755 RepID=A0ABS4IVH6_9BACL|nr:alanine racemase [Paenibacillus eucommiae]MBP1991579.1 D-serine deaminase-like pyridoxal phosphate-dependent protein [Paenibacillus eucommiae]
MTWTPNETSEDTPPTPYAFVDLDAVELNIARMADKLASYTIKHRPHIKTHKSLRLVNMQLAAGAIGITVAKLSEAEAFADGGINDILIAFAIVGEQNLERLERLHRRITVAVTVDSWEAAQGLSAVGVRASKPVRVLIELDGGLHRGGRQPGKDIVDFAIRLRELPGIQIEGIMAYFGLVYRNGDPAAIAAAVQAESETIGQVVADLRQAGFAIEIISSGSTPTAKLCEHAKGITEVRAGNYIFNDVSAVQMGMAQEADCALRVAATVVSMPLPGMATIDAGTKALTSDRAHHSDGFGIIVGQPDITIAVLNEEHGMLRFDPDKVSLSIGDRIEIIPNHSCVIPNLNDAIYGVRRGVVLERIQIDARGCNY